MPVYTLLLVLTMLLNMGEVYCDRHAAVRSHEQQTALYAALAQVALLTPLIGLIDPLGFVTLLIVAAVAAVSAGSRVLWYRALASSSEDLSRLMPMLRISTLLSVVVSFALLDEEVSAARWLGTAIITAGAIALSVDLEGRRVRLRLLTVTAGLSSAVGIAAINFAYKYLLDGGCRFLTVFVCLKLAQAAVISVSLLGSPTREAFNLERPRAFMLARVLQTVAALIYVFALAHVDLSYAAPLTAASPLLYVLLDWLLARRGVQRTRAPTTLRLAAVGVIGLGVLLLGSG